MKVKSYTLYGQPSWRVATGEVELFITKQGGHLGPVTFTSRRRRIQPYAIAPWAEEEGIGSLPPILRVLRGDFFCLPFGGNSTSFRGEKHPIHGETANELWRWESQEQEAGRVRLHLSLRTKVRRGRVDKFISLVAGQPAVYCRHVISGMSGPMSFGHHAMLKFPDQPGSGVISTSQFVRGQVFPEPAERPENRGYSCLKPGAEFTALEQVPMANGDLADLSRYPARRGFEDIAMIVSDPDVPFAWTAVTVPRQRYVWFALKDPRILHSTIFWISNGGRHYPPWNGRHLNVMGLEEVTSWFHPGLAESVRENPSSDGGTPTSVLLDPARPLTVNYIMAVASVPAGFDRLVRIEPDAQNEAVTLHCARGERVTVPLSLRFLGEREAESELTASRARSRHQPRTAEP